VVRHVTGGANNALYRVETGRRTYAAKLCVADGRRRAAREFGALRLLRAAELDIAPQPVWLDESCAVVPFPVVVYHWLPGEPLGPVPTSHQLTAM
jgi:Ser/Thr protein kinase RdoA (MazF antagonist)